VPRYHPGMAQPACDYPARSARAVRIASAVSATIGAWLVPAPWALSAAAGSLFATWVSVCAGASVALLALVRVAWPLQGAALSFANLLIGVLGALLIASFANLGTLVAWNGIVGLTIVALLALRSVLITLAGERGREPAP